MQLQSHISGRKQMKISGSSIGCLPGASNQKLLAWGESLHNEEMKKLIAYFRI
jgi:hypothetical protein